MKFRKDTRGIAGGKAMLIGVVAIVAVAALFLSGVVQIGLPTVEDKLSQTVVRGVTDVGMVVPLMITLTFDQDSDTGIKTADVAARITHKHDTPTTGDNNYVPDPELVSSSSYNVKVGNVGDVTTIYAINGDSFRATNQSFNGTKTSLGLVQYGNVQDNYKVWTESDMFVPPTTVPGTRDCSGILIQTQWDHYQKGTDTLLDSDIVNILVSYRMPDYDQDESYTQTYLFNVFVPFSSYGVVEDIWWEVKGYREEAIIEWTTFTASKTIWDFPLLNLFFPSIDLKWTHDYDVSLPTGISHVWTGPYGIGVDNDDTDGSHRYLYKVR